MAHSKYPLLLPTLALVLGIFFYTHSQIAFSHPLVLLVLCVMAFVAFKYPIKKLPVVPLLLAAFFFLMGWWRASFTDPLQHPQHFTKWEWPEKTQFYGTVSAQLKASEKNFRYVVDLSGAASHHTGQPLVGKVLLNLPRVLEPVALGAPIVWRGNLQHFGPAAYPGAFDYGAYLAQEAIYGQFFIRGQSDFLVQPNRQPASFLMARYRLAALDVVQNLEMLGANKAFLAALLLGTKDGLTTNQRADFSAAGTMHLLAVSGLHVGIVYLIGFTLLGMGRGQVGQFWKVPVLLGFIWLYALLTGLSPSVTRAATMFSGFAFGNLLERRSSTLHLLLASAFLLLAMRPALLFHAGFQLSYAAVWAIVSFVPIFQKYWQPKSWLALKIRDLLTVSLAAQMGTLPITLYYFQSFPTYFLLGNLLVLPVIPLVMYAGLGAVASGFLGLPGSWLVHALDGLLLGINFLVGIVADLPYAQLVFAKWWVGFYILMAVFVAITLAFLKTHNFKWLLAMGCALVLLSVVQLTERHQKANTAGYMALHHPAGMGLLVFDGFEAAVVWPFEGHGFEKVVLPFCTSKGLQIAAGDIEFGNHQTAIWVGGKLLALNGVPKTPVASVIWSGQPPKNLCNGGAPWLVPRAKKTDACWQPFEVVRETKVVEWRK